MWRKRLWRAIALGISGLCIWPLVSMIQIVCYASERDDGPADAAIVLGAAVWEGAPSPVFAARLDHAIALYHQGRVRALILTGGVGEGDTLAESEAGQAYALAQDVPATAIFTENVSHITLTNLTGAGRIVREQGFDRVLLVSDPLHMKRAIVIARDLDLNAYPSPTPTSRYRTLKTQMGFLLRETYYYTGYWLRRFFNQGSSISTSAVIPQRSSCGTSSSSMITGYTTSPR
ncbi:MAG: YdcF family protein [Anaerolineae bacterium]|nr:YdcF family protein [Anaerolineae bacterium]